MNTFANALTAALGRCIVSKTVTENNEPVGFAYRETPVFENDSGWRFFSGEESDEYTGNPENFAIHTLNDITSLNPALLPLLQEAEGAWEIDDSGNFIPVADWQPIE
ncbi:MAG: DUF2185 domain-containing protein [Neisseria sp.]|uniref:DUF2185 domain-containing protein n=1 Tax=Neisseria sp. TaxID=192066 RepID=UPI0026DB3102|nr:DUF2185 domain-containing protein [Neisseria sp.]MDO4640413.1 DUF2185 domain-containing protein [Neisseria sp.]